MFYMPYPQLKGIKNFVRANTRMPLLTEKPPHLFHIYAHTAILKQSK